ncbi:MULTISPECIES: hypothetical protein [Streptomyces]|uniref:hypothetical protein n=1 Tax=Streptomyces TaxID=1883 RepID=UPI00163CE1FB|nr:MULTISPECIES: hypothetical protein [Streptomyces]MBC2877853.1 hypothetical protein [Streptomyces sp. TYQ1024]UBI37990.1 hypothetical protein K7I03_16935 [Streptomyces mobaraensis]UKW30577.1 hypothetical protein MCU78_16890 [Streptomyces sp. TYQ1024]
MRSYVEDQQVNEVLRVQGRAFSGSRPSPAGFRELFHGVPGETAEERAARLAVAESVLTELLELGETDEVAAEDALYAAHLNSTALWRVKIDAWPSWAKRAA